MALPPVYLAPPGPLNIGLPENLLIILLVVLAILVFVMAIEREALKIRLALFEVDKQRALDDATDKLHEEMERLIEELDEMSALQVKSEQRFVDTLDFAISICTDLERLRHLKRKFPDMESDVDIPDYIVAHFARRESELVGGQESPSELINQFPTDQPPIHLPGDLGPH